MGLFKRSTSNQGDQLMSETLTKIIVDCSTGVVAEVPLTGEELAQREADAQAAAACGMVLSGADAGFTAGVRTASPKVSVQAADLKTSRNPPSQASGR